MATITGDNIPVKKTIHINPLSFVLDMSADLWLVIGFTILTVAFIYLPQLNGTIIRPVLGISMVLFLPGYALAAAVFPGKKDVGGIERAVLSFGLSIAMVPMVGLALNYTQWGVRLDPTIVCVTILTLIFVLVANKRRHDIPEEGRFSIDFLGAYRSINSETIGDKTRIDKALTVVLIVALLLITSMTAYVIAMPGHDEKYTEFYLLGPEGMAENYPYKYILGDEKTVIVGIANHESRNMTYDLVASLDDLNNSTTVKLYSESIMLPENEVWEKAINVTPDLVGINMKMEFLLYADGNMSAPYKECHLLVNVTKPTPRPTMRPVVVPSRYPTPTPVRNPIVSSPINYTSTLFSNT